MADGVFTELANEVTNLEGVVPSVVAIINGIAGQIEAAVAADNLADSSASAALAARVRAQATALAEAAAANNPPAPAPAPGTAPEPEPEGSLGNS